jgi:hypothetical protein
MGFAPDVLLKCGSRVWVHEFGSRCGNPVGSPNWSSNVPPRVFPKIIQGSQPCVVPQSCSRSECPSTGIPTNRLPSIIPQPWFPQGGPPIGITQGGSDGVPP